MRFNPPIMATGLLFSLIALNTEAALTPYTSAGENLVYSNVSDITWTADANLLGTMITNQGYDTVVNAIIAVSPLIYDTPNYYNGFYDNYASYSGTYGVSTVDFIDLGLTTWYGAQAFVGYLNSINYAGSHQWALPTAGANPQFGYNQTGSQLGQLYYNELNALAYPGTNGSNYGILGDGSVGTSGSVGPFNNVQTSGYWSGTEYAELPDFVWDFGTYNGRQNVNFKSHSFRYAWAVTAVPVPGAVWLFGTGLVGLLSLKRRRHAL